MNSIANCSNYSSQFDPTVSPVTLSRVETIVHLICISQGIPINLLIGVVIARNRRLHNPRNTFWLGIIVLNLLTIFMAVLKLLVVHVDDPAHFTCLLFSFMTGKPYTIVLFIVLLAILDRYVGISDFIFNLIGICKTILCNNSGSYYVAAVSPGTCHRPAGRFRSNRNFPGRLLSPVSIQSIHSV